MISTLAAWNGRRSRIPFDMFALERSAEEARKLPKLRNIYHRGQELAWDGREVLGELLAKHGGIHVDEDKRRALARVFEIILWGELAAWKISAELADELVPVEAKMAATSQAHDEARHFYVMYDYLRELGYTPTRIDPCSQRVLDLTLEAPKLTYKILGMQLMIETIALTIFQTVRESRVEPVLADLLLYYEKDEARHVGLGTQYLPALLRKMSPAEGVATTLFQLRIVFWTLTSLKAMERDLATLGITAPKLIHHGRAKQMAVFEELWRDGTPPATGEWVNRIMNGVEDAIFPGLDAPRDLRSRLARFRTAFAVTRAAGTDDAVEQLRQAQG
ncbi:MAG TPA: ferritin-like domain-containing protein [Polyangia bacterium]|jgi:hypothetical protein